MRGSSTSVDPRPEALSLDLFGTIVFFDGARVPRRRIGEEERFVTVDDLEGLLERAAPGVGLPAFLDALATVGSAIVREKQDSLREVPTAARFARALQAVGARGGVAEAAVEMAARHMTTLADAVVCPPDRVELLDRLAADYPLALVSNFDDAATARRLLDGFGLTRSFRTICISADVGVIKPSPAIFAFACRELGCAPAAVLHVGDSASADVKGAASAGLRSVWIGSGDSEPALGAVGDLAELPAWLDARYG